MGARGDHFYICKVQPALLDEQDYLLVLIIKRVIFLSDKFWFVNILKSLKHYCQALECMQNALFVSNQWNELWNELPED